MSDSIIRLKPHYYIHVLDNNSNVTRLLIGPQTFIRQDHEKVVLGPESMIQVPPRNYCIIGNPILRDDKDKPVVDDLKTVKLRFGDQEIRQTQDPFPLYPGEFLVGKVQPLQLVQPNTALRLRALRDSKDDKGNDRKAGDEWLFDGPATYIPRVEVEVVQTVKANIVKPNQALRLIARKECVDYMGKERKAGEEWIMNKVGAYLPQVDEEIVSTVDAFVLTEKKALHLQATRTFVDKFGKERKAGEEWLVTMADAETYIPDVYEKVVGQPSIISLNSRQYCVVVDPVGDDGKQRLGQRILRKGDVSFFLKPGEKLEKGIQNVYVLRDDEALLLYARESFSETVENVKVPVTHQPGDTWMIHGPCDYFPPVEVEVIEKRRSIPLDENEGIYVRDNKTGKVRAVIGTTYMLKANEELWEKTLNPTVEQLLQKEVYAERANYVKAGDKPESRDKTRVVTYRVPHNAAVQIYDYIKKTARVVFGPDLVMLLPDEHFTVLSLSGGKPKKPNTIKALACLLGPDFMTDIITVETSDHARLQLQLSYNWYFDLNRSSEADAARLFQVPDFVGDACKAIASRVRGTVASVAFDEFHKNSAKIIRRAVFGIDAQTKIRERFEFPQNKLVITNIDIQSVEPVDNKTRESLQKSVQLAIEITTKSQEATAKHEAERAEQQARARLETQKIVDQGEAEKARKQFLLIQAESSEIETRGHATAEARAAAEAAAIEGDASVKLAEYKAKARKLEADASLQATKNSHGAEIEHRQQLDGLEINKASQLAEIEAKKFKDIVGAIGADTIKAISLAGPEMQVKLLKSLGLQSVMITDGNSPINLFSTANGLLGNAAAQQQTPQQEY
jgi:major vault protein